MDDTAPYFCCTYVCFNIIVRLFTVGRICIFVVVLCFYWNYTRRSVKRCMLGIMWRYGKRNTWFRSVTRVMDMYSGKSEEVEPSTNIEGEK